MRGVLPPALSTAAPSSRPSLHHRPGSPTDDSLSSFSQHERFFETFAPPVLGPLRNSVCNCLTRADRHVDDATDLCDGGIVPLTPALRIGLRSAPPSDADLLLRGSALAIRGCGLPFLGRSNHSGMRVIGNRPPNNVGPVQRLATSVAGAVRAPTGAVRTSHLTY